MNRVNILIAGLLGEDGPHAVEVHAAVAARPVHLLYAVVEGQADDLG